LSPRDPASDEFGKWARAQAGVSDVVQTQPEPEPTHEEKVADAIVGGADGGAGRDEDRGERERDPNDALREAVAIQRMRNRL
jgi:hypothetical protein